MTKASLRNFEGTRKAPAHSHISSHTSVLKKGKSGLNVDGELSSRTVGPRVTPSHCERPGIQRCYGKAFRSEYFSKVTTVEQTENYGRLCQMP